MQDWLKQYWLEAVFGAITAVLSWIARYSWHRIKAMDEGLLALLHSELYKECEICEHKGFASVDDMKNIEYLYNPYHKLGGNGTGTELFERIKKLPVEPKRRDVI